MKEKYLGVDIGAENIKFVELTDDGSGLKITDKKTVEHQKDPTGVLRAELGEKKYAGLTSAAVVGRLGRLLDLERVPTKRSIMAGFDLLFPGKAPATIVSIGSHGFFVLELRENGNAVFRENSRCSQGTGNFLRQLVGRFNLSIEEASDLCESIEDPSALSGRCPVILKTDMTHLANKGTSRANILAGLYDAVCENVQSLIKPHISPSQVYLTGGVSKSARIRANFADFLSSRGMNLAAAGEDDLLYLEAIGAAAEAARQKPALPDYQKLFAIESDKSFELAPPLKDSLKGVKRFPPRSLSLEGKSDLKLIIGLDIGSTGSKLTAIETDSREPVIEKYTNTNGDPIGAAKSLVEQFIADGGDRQQVVAFGATGSGREIVGSLLETCYGPEKVFVLNEIAAHAEGALYYDSEVDTIFEIGGQDAKYIRLDKGQVCDAAMNEACSAGTGSFIEEQGKKFSDVESVIQMGEMALESDYGISLGQHCSVFMAEIIDAAVSAGKPQNTIISGIYDSIIQNYLNRVKGARPVGSKVFCQGMPFSSDALAAAVVRQTGREVVIPSNPGTVGAMGIAFLAARELDMTKVSAADLQTFISAEVLSRDSFECKSTKGCGGSGNHCRIQRLKTEVAGKEDKFLWGGSCSMYDAGVYRRKLPDRSPDPFTERSRLIEKIAEEAKDAAGDGPTIAITDEFMLKMFFPFFTTFFKSLGFRPLPFINTGRRELKRGIELANVALCAPMQLYTGTLSFMAEADPDYIFLPVVRDLPRVADEPTSTTCPLAQASRDMLAHDLLSGRAKLIRPTIDMGAGNLGSKLLKRTCRELFDSLDAGAKNFDAAFAEAVAVQSEFDRECARIGEQALEFCREHEVPPVVVLGRAYTIYNDILNSNIPSLLREQGAMAIPVDCYRPTGDLPVFDNIFWGYSQINLRAAHSIRREPDVYSIFSSNYSCGPDSFNLHFYSYIMENKPFAIIETDGHSGDAGTKTRVEAFLYCVDGDRRAEIGSTKKEITHLNSIEEMKTTLDDVKEKRQILLFPRMGENAEVLAAGFRGEGFLSEALPEPTRETVRLGRKYTSGKECVPMTITLGSVLERILNAEPDETFCVFMPTADGPCRFGVYNLLHKIVYSKLGLNDRVSVLSQPDHNYFEGVPPGFEPKTFISIIAGDLLHDMLHNVRPVETEAGAANRIYAKYSEKLYALLEKEPAPPLGKAISKIFGGMFGIADLLKDAADEFARYKDFDKHIPEVSFVGEIYVRCDPFANDFVIDRLEERGIRVRMAPVAEWIEYSDWLNYKKLKEDRMPFIPSMPSLRLSTALKHVMIERLYYMVRARLRLPPRTTVEDSMAASAEYLSPDLHGEAVLTLGGPLHEYLAGDINGVISVGPLECMPSKISEAEFFHASEKTGIPALTVYVNGDQVDDEILDNFAYDVRANFEAAENKKGSSHDAAPGFADYPTVRLARNAAKFLIAAVLGGK